MKTYGYCRVGTAKQSIERHLATKKSVEVKRIIRHYNSDFGGSLNNWETMKLVGCRRIPIISIRGSWRKMGNLIEDKKLVVSMIISYNRDINKKEPEGFKGKIRKGGQCD